MNNYKYNKLANTIVTKAFISKDGEIAWRKEDIPDAIKNIVENNFVIIGGEIWIVYEDKIKELYWLSLSTEERKSYESWLDFIKRTEQEYINWLDRLDNEIGKSDNGKVYYLVEFIDEESYFECVRKIKADKRFTRDHN